MRTISRDKPRERIELRRIRGVRSPGDRKAARKGSVPPRKRPPQAPAVAPPRIGPNGDRQPSSLDANPLSRLSSHSLHEDDLLTVNAAAVLADRSTRTIRRAYRAGTLIAYRDGNGRGIRIRYGDLRRWLTATTAAAPLNDGEEQPQAEIPLECLDMTGKRSAQRPSDNLALLSAARAERRDGARNGAAQRRAAGSAGASPA